MSEDKKEQKLPGLDQTAFEQELELLCAVCANDRNAIYRKIYDAIYVFTDENGKLPETVCFTLFDELDLTFSLMEQVGDKLKGKLITEGARKAYGNMFAGMRIEWDASEFKVK